MGLGGRWDRFGRELCRFWKGKGLKTTALRPERPASPSPSSGEGGRRREKGQEGCPCPKSPGVMPTLGCFFFLTDVELIYVVLISGVQHRDSVIRTYIPFGILFHNRPLEGIEYSSLCYT